MMFMSSFFFMISGMMLMLSSVSWVSCWVGLELMTLGFIPFFFLKKNFLSKSSSWKYFLVQSISSIIFFISLSSLNVQAYFCFLKMSDSFSILIFLSMMVKLGMFPFHGWVLSISESMNWLSFFIFSTFQKIGPLLVIKEISIFFYNSKIKELIVIFSLCMSVACIYEFSVRKLLIYSSILNMSWLILASLTQVSMKNLIFFFVCYFFSLMVVLFFLSKQNFNRIQDIFQSSNFCFSEKVCNMFAWGSLCGIPPFANFFPKILIISDLSKNLNFFLCLLLLFSSMIFIFFYFPFLSHESFFFKKKMINMKNSFQPWIMVMNFVIVLSISLLSLLFFFLY